MRSLTTTTLAQARRLAKEECKRRAQYAAHEAAVAARQNAATAVYDIGFRAARLTEDVRVYGQDDSVTFLEAGRILKVVDTGSSFMAFLPAEGTRAAQCITLKPGQIQWVD